MRTLNAMRLAVVVIVAASLGGCMTDQQAAQATPEQKKADQGCDTDKAIAAIPGALLGIGGALLTSAIGGALSENCHKKAALDITPERLPPPGPAVAWVDPDSKRR